MQSERFEWDDNKAAENYAKHHVTFELAKSVFDDPLSRSMIDPRHSDIEHRFIIFGSTLFNELLVVAFADATTIAFESSALVVRRARKGTTS